MTPPTQPDSLRSKKPAAGFDDPFGMMEACHERLGRMLSLATRLREHLAQHGADEQARQAARDVMRYFDQAAPQHHRDEELHVFPRLAAVEDGDTKALVERLRGEHEAMEGNWPAARAVLQSIADGALASLSPQDRIALDAFLGPQSAHAEAEERVAYPAARMLLGEQDIALMGAEMRARRGV